MNMLELLRLTQVPTDLPDGPACVPTVEFPSADEDPLEGGGAVHPRGFPVVLLTQL